MSNTVKARALAVRAAIGVALIAICIFAFTIYSNWKAKKAQQELLTAKQSVISTQARVDKAKSEYVAIKDKDVKKEKEVAQNAFNKACEDCSNDADTLIAWSELLDRARNANRQRSKN